MHSIKRIQFGDGTWGILLADSDIEGDFPGEMELGSYLIDRGLVNPRSEQILGVERLIDMCLWLIHGKDRA